MYDCVPWYLSHRIKPLQQSFLQSFTNFSLHPKESTVMLADVFLMWHVESFDIFWPTEFDNILAQHSKNFLHMLACQLVKWGGSCNTKLCQHSQLRQWDASSNKSVKVPAAWWYERKVGWHNRWGHIKWYCGLVLISPMPLLSHHCTKPMLWQAGVRIFNWWVPCCELWQLGVWLCWQLFWGGMLEFLTTFLFVGLGGQCLSVFEY